MTATRTDAGTRSVPAAALRRAQAFGLDIETTFEAPGLPRATGPPSGRRTRLELATAAEIDRSWPAGAARRVLEERFGDGAPARTIDAHPRRGYRLYARRFGLARISPNGARVVCAPPPAEPWSWQRFLVGRILPWAAVLRGLEAFHASAVAFGGRAIALAGETGAGKTSLAVQLVYRGGEFLTDDVLTVSGGADGPIAYPGAAIASVRPAERELIPDPRWNELGRVLGQSGKTYVALPRADGPRPLGAVYFLGRDEGPAIERVAAPDPRALLAATFVLGVQTPARLMNQLDVCAGIAHNVPLYRLRLAPGVSAERLAQEVHAHIEREVAA